MWIEELENGKFKYVERYLDEKTGKNKTVSVTLTKKSPRAKKEAIAILNKRINKRKTTPHSKVTLGQVVHENIMFKKKHWAISTLIKNESFYKRYIEGYPEAEYVVEKLTLKDIQSILDLVQYDKNHSRATTQSVKSLIGQSLSYAEDEYKIPFSINFKKIHLKESQDKKINIATNKIPQLLKSVRKNMNELYADVVECQLLTGMRIGELRALTKDDWKDGKISITKSVERMTNIIKTPKNKQSIRVIDSTERIDEIFAHRIKMNDALFGSESKLIFASQVNGPITYTYLQELLKKVNPDLSSHYFRHAHITLLVEKGFSIKYIMERVGHSNPETTLKIYTHITENMEKEAIDKLDKLF